MDHASAPDNHWSLGGQIEEYVSAVSGLECAPCEDGSLRVIQKVDGKAINIQYSAITNVIRRSDAEGVEFIQINFDNGTKILLTENLVGFKPASLNGLDLGKLPKVVTTPDILSVFEAIQDALESPNSSSYELSLLKKVYEAILVGAESIGFKLAEERTWLSRLPTSVRKVSA